jgi:hypothetical protein
MRQPAGNSGVSLPPSPLPVDRAGAARQALIRRVVLGVVASATIVIALFLLGSPLAVSMVKSRARVRGFDVDIGGASVGWGRIHLVDVKIHSPELAGMGVTLARADIFPSATLGLRRIEVHGGTVRLEGSYDEVSARIEAFRAAHAMPNANDPARARSAPPVLADGIDVDWLRAPRASDRAHAWGARYERAGDGRETVGADKVRLSSEGSSVEAERGSLEMRREGERRMLVGSSADRVTVRVDVDTLLGRAADEPPRAPKVDAPLHSNVQRGKAEVEADEPDPLRGPKLRERIRSAAAKAATLLPPSGRIQLPQARFEVRHAGETLNIGPATIIVAREPDRVRLSVTSAAGEGRTPLELEVAAPIAEGPVDIGLAGGPLPLAALGVREGDMGFEEVDRAEIEVRGHARLGQDGRSLSLSGHSRVVDLSLREPRLAADSVHGLRLSLGGDVNVALDGSRVAFESLEIGIGRVKLLTTGSLSRAEGHAKADLHLEVPLTACSDLLWSIPPELVPLLSGLEVSGTFALAGDVSLDTKKPADVAVDFTAANGCRITKVPEALSPERFRRPWVRSVLGADKAPTTLESGPGSPGWVSLADVSPYVTTAVVICEDAHFFTHDGFDGKSIQDSIRDDLRAGKFVRGGSTVSMQLAKNLYLGREKTLSRKLQEAVLTLLLEQTLGKQAILELYLNVVELAPGIYGIGPAASYYFRTKPKDLSLAQALYLVSLLPNPRSHHFGSDGVLRDTWAEYLRHLMAIAHKMHRINDAELASGLAENLRFGAPSTNDERGEAESGPSVGSASSDVLEMAPRDDPSDARGP